MISYLFGSLVAISSCTLFKISRGRILGLEKLPRTPFILAANHVSYLDWLILHSVFRLFYRRRICFIAKKRLFRPMLWRLLMQYSGAIYLDQDKPSLEMLKTVAKTLKKKNMIIGIFPEGKRSETGVLLKGQNGVVRIAALTKVPVVPVGLNGFYEMLPKGSVVPKIHPCSIRIGEPLSLQSDTKETPDEATTAIMRKIAELTDQQYIYG